MKNILSICFGSLLLIVFNGFTVNSQPSLFSKNVFNQGGDSLLYRFAEPDYTPGRKYPLVIFLHGSGERGNDNEAQLKWGVMNFVSNENLKQFPAYVLAPQCPEGVGWNVFTQREKDGLTMAAKASLPMELLHSLILQKIKEGRIDPSRIYITGLSMGGFGTFDAMARYPDLFAAAVPVCGGGDPTKASIIAHIPTWIFHGAEDQTVDPASSRAMHTAMTKAGAHPGYTEYPETGHFSWIAAYSDPMMMAWLFRQHK